MPISSIHIQTSTASADIHNKRVFVPDYLISQKNSETIEINSTHISTLEQQAKDDYKAHSKNHRAMPKNATLIKEAIINLKKDSTKEEIKELCANLEKEFGYKIKNVSIHKDEGYIFTEEKNFTMGREQYRNEKETPYVAEFDKKNKKFYEWKKEGGEWQNLGEIKDYKIKHNHHAHIMLLNYNFTTHRTVRLQKKDMSRLQTVVATSLKMERGKCSSTVEAKKLGVEVQESRKRMNIREYKEMKQKEANTLKATIKDVKAQFKQEKQALIDSHSATKDDYAELRARYKELEEQARQKDLTIKELEDKKIKLYDSIKQNLKEEIKLKHQIKKSNATIEELNNKNKVEIEIPIENPINRSLEAENVALKKELLDENKINQNLKKELLDENKIYKETQNKLIEARETILKHEAMISSQKVIINDLRAYISDLELQIKQFRAINKHEQLQRQEKRKQLNESKKSLKAEEYELSSFIASIKPQDQEQDEQKKLELDELFEDEYQEQDEEQIEIMLSKEIEITQADNNQADNNQADTEKISFNSALEILKNTINIFKREEKEEEQKQEKHKNYNEENNFLSPR